MKKILISLLSIIFIISMITTVYAASGSIALGSSVESVVKGKTFTMTVAGAADNKITGLQATLSYDKNKLSIESKTPGTGFNEASGSNEIAIAASSSENLSTAGTLYTIVFKVLDNAEVGDTTITVSNATLALVNGNSEQENVKAENESITIKIKEDDTTVGGNQDKVENKVENKVEPENTVENKTPSNTNSGNKSNTNTSTPKKNTTTKNKVVNKINKLPQTGIESASVLAIIALGSISIASYVSYRRYKNI